MANIIVYGSGWAGIAAAAKAAKNARGATVHLISPYPDSRLGGISTIGGQNFIEVREWNKTEELPGEIVQGGSFLEWYKFFHEVKYYNTNAMAIYLKAYVAGPNSNVVIHDCTDISDIITAKNPHRVIGIHLRKIAKDNNGLVVWANGVDYLPCDIVIDASDDGKIARNVCPNIITGRFDWPEEFLHEDENKNGVAKQQAAILMFKMTGIVDDSDSGDVEYEFDNEKKVNRAWGGNKTCTGLIDGKDKIRKFNEKFKKSGYMLTPFKAARDGILSNDFWVGSLLVFNVDGRRHYRDNLTGLNPTTYIPGTKSADEAYMYAVNFLNRNADEILDALKEFPGFNSAEFVTENGKIAVGDTLYIRESVHTSRGTFGYCHNTENKDFHLTTNACYCSGTGTDGADRQNYTTRIGLGYYFGDLHPATTCSLKNGEDDFTWELYTQRGFRLDECYHKNKAPFHPVYIPYRVLVTESVANLLVPGYAANMSSLAWNEMRAFPNQAVLGDAAGVTAAYCVLNSTCPNSLDMLDISIIQNMLRTEGARLDK